MKFNKVDVVILSHREHEEAFLTVTIYLVDGRRVNARPTLEDLALTNAQAVIHRVLRVANDAIGKAQNLSIHVSDKQALALLQGVSHPSTPEIRTLVGRINGLTSKTSTKVAFEYGGMTEVFGAGSGADVWDG